MDRRKAGAAALIGSTLWVFGGIAVTLGELEWRNDIADNPIPDWLSAPGVAIGSALLLISLRAFNENVGADLRPIARAGYWIAFAGLAISIAAIWPFIILGPFLAGIGLTLYGFERASLPGAETAGAWIHALSFPAAAAVGILAAMMGYEGAVWTLGFVGFLILGFVAIGLRLLRTTELPEMPKSSAVAG